MNLRLRAQRDLLTIHTRFADSWPITVTDPAGTSASLRGLSNDIFEAIDPQTGMLVSSRSASVSIAMESLTTAGLSFPIGIQDSSSRPWIIVFDDINGTEYTFKVTVGKPDRTLGAVLCTLEAYSGT